MTKAKALRNYFKEFYDIDTKGMSAVEVYRDFVKKQYDFNSKASGFTSAVNEMIANDLTPGGSGGGDGSDLVEVVDVLPPVSEADPKKFYIRRNMTTVVAGDTYLCFNAGNAREENYNWVFDDMPEDYNSVFNHPFDIYSTVTEKDYYWNGDTYVEANITDHFPVVCVFVFNPTKNKYSCRTLNGDSESNYLYLPVSSDS